MKRRVTSILLALVMLLSLLPTGAFAAAEGPMLKMHVRMEENGNVYEEPVTEWVQSIDSGWHVRFVMYDADGNATALKVDQVQLPDFMAFEGEVEDGWIMLRPTGVGTGVISYQGYTVQVSAILPDLGIYSKLPISEETFVNDPTIDDENNVFYIGLSPAMVDEGFKMTQISTEFGPEIHGINLLEIGTVELSQDGTYATVTVTDLTAQGHYHFEATITHPDGESQGIWGRSVWINNNMPALYCCYMEENNDIWTVNHEHANSELWGTPGNSHFVTFFFGKYEEILTGNVAPISADDLTFPAFMEVDFLANRMRPGVEVPETALDVKVTRFVDGNESCDIVYEVDGREYTLPVVVRLPEVGFYSTTTPGEDTYLYEGNPLVITETNRTFYLCVNDPQNMKISEICRWDDAEMAELFTVTPSADGAYIAFTMKDGEIAPNRGLNVEVEYQIRDNENEFWRTHRNGTWVEVLNGQATLMYRYMEWDDQNHTWYEQDDREFNTMLNLGSGDSSAVQFYYGTEESRVRVDVSELTFPAGIAKGYARDGATWVEGIGYEESGVITYTDGEVTSSLKVNVRRPEFGIYSSTDAGKATFLGENVTVDNTVDTFYVVTDDERTMTSFEGIRTNHEDQDASQYFDVQFGSANGCDYAKITLKKDADGVYMAPGGGYVLLVEQEWGIRYIHFELIRNDLQQLSTPSDLTWHIQYGWNWDDEVIYTEDRMGAMGFKVGDLTQNRYRIEIYSDKDGYTEPVLEGGWQFGDMDHSPYFSVSDFIYAELPSGVYRFRVQAEGDGTKYRDSDWSALSPEFAYTMPQAQLTTPDEALFAWERWEAMYHSTWERSLEDGARYYEVRWSYMEDGVRREHAGSFDIQAWDMENPRMDAGIPDDFLSEIGNKDLYFRVRVIPADITKQRVSAWSDYSEALVIQDITDFVNDKLDNLTNQPVEPGEPQTGLTVEDVQSALISDTADLRTAMAADLELSGGTASGTLERIEHLEQIVEDNVEQKVEAETTAPAAIQDIVDGITMVGATLNLAVGEVEEEETPSVTLKLDAPEEGIVIPEQQHNAVQFSMKLEGAVDINDEDQAGQILIVPVVIDMPVPEGINPNFLVVLHKLWDGSIEQMRPYIYWNDTDSRYHARFVVDSFSDFAMVEYFGFNVETVEKTVGDEPFAIEAVVAVEGGMITYFSSDSDVAEVDPETGVVTVKAAGTVTVTAVVSACEWYNETYATYTLIVKEQSSDDSGNGSGSGSGSSGGSSSGGSTGGGSAATQPEEKVEITFADVAEDAYYRDAVQWAVENAVTSGIGEGTFGPDANCTRAQAVTFLWSAAGRPEPKGTEMPFADVAADSYYYSAVLWAMENGITSGTGADTFSPDAICTRAQIVTFLWRCMAK